MTRSLSLLTVTMMCMLSGLALAADLHIHVSYPIVTTPTSSGTSSAITKVNLSLSTIALLHSSDAARDSLNYQVLDAIGHAMPTRIVTQLEPAHEQIIPLRVYHWPAQAPTNRAAAANLELQLNQDQAHAWVTWPDHRQRNGSTQAGKNADQTWLLALPIPEPSTQFTARKIVLTWPSTALSIQANVEGSSDLINWSSAGTSALLDTGQGTADHAQLKQTSISVDQSYRYWRITLSAPLALSNAAIVLQDPEKPVFQTQVVTFSKDASHDSWSLSLPQPIAISGLKFNIPMNQVWTLSLSAMVGKRDPMISPEEVWRLLRVKQLSHWQTPPNDEPADNQMLWIDGDERVAVSAAQWQIKGVGPQGVQLPVTMYGPAQSLYFIAQGQPPYRLEVNDPAHSDDTAVGVLSLPKTLPAVQMARLGAMQIIPPVTPWKTYGLWAVLILAVVALAIAAGRLMRRLDQQGK